MNAAYFLKARTTFIRFFFVEGQAAFGRIRVDIEEGKAPYDNPQFEDEREPPYLEEWMTANTAADVVGQASVSMLADALKLYFNTMQRRVIGFSISKAELSKTKRTGWVAMYRDAFGLIFDTDWKDCPVDFGIIEQVVLARNVSQHSTDLTSHRVVHDPNTLARHPQPWFASEDEIETWKEHGESTSSLFAPTLEVSKDKLFAAIDQIELLVDWIDGRMDRVNAWRTAAATAVTDGDPR